MNYMRALYVEKDKLWLAIILLIVEFVRSATLISFIPIYGKSVLHINLAMIGAALTAHYFTDTVCKAINGYLLDRFSDKLIINISLAISLSGICLFFFGSIPFIFLIASALYGVGVSPIWIICLTKIKEQQRAVQMGLLYMIWLAGTGCGPVILNFILDYNPLYGYFLLLSLSSFAWLLSFFIRKENQLKNVPVSQSQWRLLCSKLKTMKLLLPNMVIQTLAASMLIPILPTFVIDGLHLTKGQYSIILLLSGGCTLLNLIPMGKWIDHSNRKSFLVIGFCILSFAFASLLLHPSKMIIYLLAIVIGLSYSAILPAWNALLATYVPVTQTGFTWSILSIVESVGILSGPIIGGIIANTFSVKTVIWGSAVLFGLVAISHLFFPKRLLTE